MSVCMYFIYYIYVVNTVLSGVPLVSMICYMIVSYDVFDFLNSNGGKHSRLMQNVFYWGINIILHFTTSPHICLSHDNIFIIIIIVCTNICNTKGHIHK